MVSFVSKGDSVLEPACGPGVLAEYLSRGVSYSGFDTNKYFIDYALKKNLNAKIANVLDLKSFKKSDIVITCDILHHLNPKNRKKFIENCYKSAKKIFIVCEPEDKNSKKNSSVFFSRFLTEWLESDGTNSVKLDYFFKHKELLQFINNGFDVIPKSIKRVVKRFGEDIVAVYFKNS